MVPAASFLVVSSTRLSLNTSAIPWTVFTYVAAKTFPVDTKNSEVSSIRYITPSTRARKIILKNLKGSLLSLNLHSNSVSSKKERFEDLISTYQTQ